MTQLATVVLKDSTATNRTFVPRDIVDGVATLVSSTGIPIGDKTSSVAVSRTTTGRRKVTMKIAIPTVQDSVVNGISKPAVVRTAYADVTFTFDGASSTLERSDLLAFLASALADTVLFKPAVVDLSAPF